MTDTYAGEYSHIIKWESKACEGDDDSSVTYAAIRVNDIYLYFTVFIYPRMFAQWESGDLKMIAQDILHKLCHTLTEPMAKIALEDAKPSHNQHIRNTNERQTQRIANVMWSLLPKDWYLPDKLAAEYPDDAVTIQHKKDEGLTNDRNNRGHDANPEAQA